MPRYIDAEKAAERLNACLWGKDYDATLALACILNTPTADVVERKRGTWEAVTMVRWIYAKCSVCGTVHDTQTSFCPKCGAEMEGGNDAVF